MLIRDPLHKVRVHRDPGNRMWIADCQTCGSPLQDHYRHWFVHELWRDAMDTALRHNLRNKWMQT